MKRITTATTAKFLTQKAILMKTMLCI